MKTAIIITAWLSNHVQLLYSLYLSASFGMNVNCFLNHKLMTQLGYEEEIVSAFEMQAQWEEEELEKQLFDLQEMQDAEEEKVLKEVQSSMLREKHWH
jgi:hypothetical protein